MAEHDDLKPISLTRTIIILYVLFGMTLVKPVLDSLAENPEFFLANHVGAVDLLIIVFVMTFVLPLTIVAPVVLAQLLGRRIGTIAQVGAIFVMTALFVIQLLRYLGFLPLFLVLLAAAVIAGYVSVRYRLDRRWSEAMALLAPVILIVPAIFLFDSNLRFVLQPRQLVSAEGATIGAKSVETPRPIVLVVFDELPLLDLLDHRGKIDKSRYPNFASFAAGATWYEHATTVAVKTLLSVPAILTGRYPNVKKLARYEDYPRNLFSMLQGHYDLNIVEPVTELRPVTADEYSTSETVPEWVDRMWTLGEDIGVLGLHVWLPSQYTRFLPAINKQWGGFLVESAPTSGEQVVKADPETTALGAQGKRSKKAKKTQLWKRALASSRSDRAAMFRDFVGSIGGFPSSTLHFLHSPLPHSPLSHLPSGKIYEPTERNEAATADGGIVKIRWTGSQAAVTTVHQRHRLQIGFVDRLLGELVAELKRLGIFDESLIVITSDHGASYLSGHYFRLLSKRNFGNVAFVPMLIKYPLQREGVRDKSNRQTIDILPTIRDVVGAQLDWHFHGRSLIDPRVKPRAKKRVFGLPGPNKFVSPLKRTKPQYIAARRRALKHNRVTFTLDDTRSTMFHFGSGLSLIGRSKSEIEASIISGTVDCPDLEGLRNVDHRASSVPLRLVGKVTITGDTVQAARVAVIVNGEVQAVADTFEFEDDRVFEVILSDEILRNGTNAIELVPVMLDGPT